MYFKFNIFLILFSVCSLKVVNSQSLSIKKPESQFYSVNFDPKDFEDEEPESTTTEKLKLDREEYEIKPAFSDKDFINVKNAFRADNYAQSIYGGIRGHYKDTDIELDLNKSVISPTDEGKKLICYYAIPSFDDRPFPVFPEQIDPFLCTHIILAFARFHNGTVVFNDPNDAEFYERTLKLKEKNTDLKVMVSVGCTNDGVSEPSKEFSQMISKKESRALFINETIRFLHAHKLDGVDVDFEYPAWTGPVAQKEEFSLLFEEFREFMAKSNISFLLSAAVGSPKPIVDVCYDIKRLAASLSFILLMTYDYHFYTWITPFTGPNSPLFPSSSDLGYMKSQNVAWTSQYWRENGMPSEKIIIGVPVYGHTFKLVDKNSHGYYSLADGFGSVGSGGFANYPEICHFNAKNGTQIIFHNETRVPYSYNDRDWISFENEQSAKEKATWAKSTNFGGFMVWNINADDAYKMCNTSKTPFPIIQTLHDELFNSIE